MRKATIVTMALMLIICCIANAQTQKQYKEKLVDSFDLGKQYTAKIYDYYNLSGKVKLNEELKIFYGDKPVSSTFSPIMKAFQFEPATKTTTAVYLKDINKDGLDEIILIGHTEENGDCCNHISIHNLNGTNMKDIIRFESKEADSIFLKDLDNDLIPELFFQDANFVGWNAPAEQSPMPLLVWKWDGSTYDLANFKFADYLVKQAKANDLKKLKKQIDTRVKEYDPDDEYKKYPPPMLWGVMLDYIYAGQKATADSLFEQYWPKEIPGKQEFYNQFEKQYKSSIHWGMIEKSDR